ncbi:hypothetical protein [Mycoplasma simbae]|uniref:hypothetical protein n=1 Tax=Mycoplasma simbae TaxID=36744 RepID=UPI000495D399|nr:hypothetical protein [Mycoplasma simbae]
MKQLEKLASALELDVNLLMSKLNLKENASTKELADSLGFYGLFSDKDDLTAYIKSKVQNKQNEIDALKIESQELKQKNTDLEISIKSFNEKLNNDIKTTWEKLNLPIDSWGENILDINDIDFKNLASSVQTYAKNNNIKANEVLPNEINETNKTYSINSERFNVGSRRIK